MKTIHYPDREQICLTNKEFQEAKEFFISGSQYFCPRLNDFLSGKYWYTKDQFMSDRFDYLFLCITGKDMAIAFLHDKQKNLLYQLQSNFGRDKAIENLMARERGGEAPLYHSPLLYSEEKLAATLKLLITEDEFLDRGGYSKYKIIRAD